MLPSTWTINRIWHEIDQVPVAGFAFCQGGQIDPPSFHLKEIERSQRHAENTEDSAEADQGNPGFARYVRGKAGHVDIGAYRTDKIAVQYKRHESFAIDCGDGLGSVAVPDPGIGFPPGETMSGKNAVLTVVPTEPGLEARFTVPSGPRIR